MPSTNHSLSPLRLFIALFIVTANLGCRSRSFHSTGSAGGTRSTATASLASGSTLWSSEPEKPLAFALEADLSGLFASDDETRKEKGRVTVTGLDGTAHSLAVTVKLRGNTSLKQCRFKKLQLKFKDATKGTPFEGIESLQVGTHCDLAGPVDNFRLGDERVVAREYVAYAFARVLGVASNRARLADLNYTDTGGGTFTLRRPALLVEDHDDVATRFGGRKLDSVEEEAKFKVLTRASFPKRDVAQQHWFELLVANSDFVLADLTGTCSFDAGGFYNTKVYEKPDGSFGTVVYDFDVAWPVRETAVNRAILESGLGPMPSPELAPGKPTFTRYVSQCAQYARTRHARTDTAAVLAHFHSHRAELERTLEAIPIDVEGRANWRGWMNAFFEATSPELFSLPLVRGGTTGYADVALTQKVCTFASAYYPVLVKEKSGDSTEIKVLENTYDAKRACAEDGSNGKKGVMTVFVESNQIVDEVP